MFLLREEKASGSKMIAVNTKIYCLFVVALWQDREKNRSASQYARGRLWGNSGKHVDRQRTTDAIHCTSQDLKSFWAYNGNHWAFTHTDITSALDREAYIAILTEPKILLSNQYVKLFEMDKVKLNFQDEVLSTLSTRLWRYKLGARGLRSIVEAIMIDAMFELPSQNKKKYEVTLVR